MKASLERNGKTVRSIVRETVAVEQDGEVHRKVMEAEMDITEESS